MKSHDLECLIGTRNVLKVLKVARAFKCSGKFRKSLEDFRSISEMFD